MKKKLLKFAVTGAAAVMASAPLAKAVDADPIADGITKLTTMSTSVGGFSAVMLTLAAISTGVMIAVKWIRRGRGAA